MEETKASDGRVVEITPEYREELENCLEEAQRAYEEDDSQRVTELCKRALELDPDNARAWGLLARFGGWDSKLYHFDIDFAIDSAKYALGLLPEGERYDEAAEIYTARKKQIALILESEMMMPSYTAAKQLHGTMGEWLRLLEEIPSLNEELLRGEVTLVENLCARSRIGIMPADRLVYTAYSSLNGKETYGETFRKALAKRLDAEAGQREEAWESACANARKACDAAWAHLADEGMTPDEKQTVLREDQAVLMAGAEALKGLTNKALYQQQMRELEQQRAKLPRYKLFKVRELDARAADLRKKLAEIDAGLEPALKPIGEALAAVEAELR